MNYKQEIENCECHIEMGLNKKQQTKIGINPSDVSHIRTTSHKVLRIVAAYTELLHECSKTSKEDKNIKLEDANAKLIYGFDKTDVEKYKEYCQTNEFTEDSVVLKLFEELPVAFKIDVSNTRERNQYVLKHNDTIRKLIQEAGL